MVINALKDKTVWTDGVATVPDKVFATPDFDLVGQFSLHFVSRAGLLDRAGGRARR